MPPVCAHVTKKNWNCNALSQLFIANATSWIIHQLLTFKLPLLSYSSLPAAFIVGLPERSELVLNYCYRGTHWSGHIKSGLKWLE